MDQNIAKAVLLFLDRSDLKGAEVDAYVQVRQALRVEAGLVESPEVKRSTQDDDMGIPVPADVGR